MEIEKLGSGTYARIGNGEAWMQWLSRDETPDWPHPRDKRWGIKREPGGTTVYLGRLVVTMSQRSTTRRPNAATT